MACECHKTTGACLLRAADVCWPFFLFRDIVLSPETHSNITFAKRTSHCNGCKVFEIKLSRRMDRQQ